MTPLYQITQEAIKEVYLFLTPEAYSWMQGCLSLALQRLPVDEWGDLRHEAQGAEMWYRNRAITRELNSQLSEDLCDREKGVKMEVGSQPTLPHSPADTYTHQQERENTTISLNPSSCSSVHNLGISAGVHPFVVHSRGTKR